MLGSALAHSWSWGLRKYAFPPVSLLAQTLCKVREEEEQILLVAPYWPILGSQSWCSSWQPLPGRFLWWRIYCLRDGAPASRPLETSCLVPGRGAEVLSDLPQEGVYIITSARTLSTRHAYALKLNLFVEWCSSHREDPGKCPIRVILFLFAATVGAKAVSLHP